MCPSVSSATETFESRWGLIDKYTKAYILQKHGMSKTENTPSLVWDILQRLWHGEAMLVPISRDVSRACFKVEPPIDPVLFIARLTHTVGKETLHCTPDGIRKLQQAATAAPSLTGHLMDSSTSKQITLHGTANSFPVVENLKSRSIDQTVSNWKNQMVGTPGRTIVYECTFKQCTRAFFAYKDWVKHEDTEHPWHEFWRCSVADNSGQLCGRSSFFEALYNLHLEEDHGLNGHGSRRHLHDDRFGVDRFWCGFCNSRIQRETTWQQGERGQREARWRHIGWHFEGGNELIPWKDATDSPTWKIPFPFGSFSGMAETPAAHAAIPIPGPSYSESAIITLRAIVESNSQCPVAEETLRSWEESLKSQERIIFGLLAVYHGQYPDGFRVPRTADSTGFEELKTLVSDPLENGAIKECWMRIWSDIVQPKAQQITSCTDFIEIFCQAREKIRQLANPLPA